MQVVESLEAVEARLGSRVEARAGGLTNGTLCFQDVHSQCFYCLLAHRNPTKGGFIGTLCRRLWYSCVK